MLFMFGRSAICTCITYVRADVRYDDRIQGYSPSVRKLCKNLLLGQLSILTHVRLMDTGFEADSLLNWELFSVRVIQYNSHTIHFRSEGKFSTQCLRRTSSGSTPQFSCPTSRNSNQLWTLLLLLPLSLVFFFVHFFSCYSVLTHRHFMLSSVCWNWTITFLLL